MGAYFNTVSLSGSKEEVAAAFLDVVADERHWGGNDPYAGHIGLLNRIERFVDGERTYREAESYLQEEHQKWDDAIAVSYQENGETHWLVGGWCPS